LQAVEALSQRHQPLPIYISRSGGWYAGQELRDIAVYRSDDAPAAQEVSFDLHRGQLLPAASSSLLRGLRKAAPIELDLVVIATHGTEGEDGCLTGALELAGLPYVGPPVGAAAAAMDKIASKAVLSAASLPIVDHLALRREAFERDQDGVIGAILDRFALPLYVKPASLGSSIGVSRCEERSQLQGALQLCFELDRACVVEPAIEGGVEVNCAVLGRPGFEPKVSVCEQPIAAQSFLSFEDKYIGGGKAEGKQSAPSEGARSEGARSEGAPSGETNGPTRTTPAGSKDSEAAKGRGMQSARRLIPAPIGQERTESVQQLAKLAFEAFGCAGVSRIDFLIDRDGEIYVNECNTIPGSFSFYLWEPAGLRFVDLMDELIDIAYAEHAEKARTITVFQTNLLADRAASAKT
jgi:D-alanine-D-alanine ligase